MKYMGSKRAMLRSGLGHLLQNEINSVCRFVDLFTGSGAVAIFVARRFPIPVFAIDLQQYSAILTHAVISRDKELNWEEAWKAWHRRAITVFNASAAPVMTKLTQRVVADFRAWCTIQSDLPITRAYGGHYFSPQQSVWIDAFRVNLPKTQPAHTVALAALIQAASQCTAAPGHTAQPFQPTRTAKRFLQEAWTKDIVERTRQTFATLAITFAQKCGRAEVADANHIAGDLNKHDLVFIDPPYSGVHYSRFYHVLETIARGDSGEVSGVGRYPAADLRPRSRCSLKTESAGALDELLQNVASRGARAILTFPDHHCSNGLSGDLVREIAHRHFEVQEHLIASTFSTLGGTRTGGDDQPGRAARRHGQELILILNP